MVRTRRLCVLHRPACPAPPAFPAQCVVHRKRLHLERSRPVRIDGDRRADAVLPHRGAEARQER